MNPVRVVVTGLGVISPIGSGREAFWQGLKEGRSGVRRVDDVLDLKDIPCKIGARVDDFNPLDYVEKRRVRRLGRATLFALAALRWTLEDGRLDPVRLNRDRFGVVMGTGIGAVEAILESHMTLLRQGPRRVSPFFITKFMPNAVAAEVALECGARGPNFGAISACASSAHAIGLAADLIKLGYADVILAGGSEAAMWPLTFAGFDQIRALSRRNDSPETASRPFDATRDGFVLGEGAGLLLLEREDHARERGAPLYAEVAGFGQSCDAHHITEPAPDGLGAQRAMRMALERAAVKPEEVGYINAHGTSTPLNDKTETRAIRAVFPQPPPTSSTKSQIGHLLGAAGAVEAVAALMALEEGILPPTINHTTPDPECDLDVVPNAARPAQVDLVLSNAFGFGGHNATLVFRRL